MRISLRFAGFFFAAWMQVTAATVPEPVVNFALLDHQGRMHELRRSDGAAVLLFFTANDCPVARQSASKLRDLQERFGPQGLRVWLVNANSGDDRKGISKEAHELGIWHLPVLKDETQGVARHLGVRRTGEAVLISTKDWTEVYHGAIDDQFVEGAAKPQPTDRFLENALTAFLGGKPVSVATTVAHGCLIHFEGGIGADQKPVSYTKEVAPILSAKCVSCHSEGNIGSWAMKNHRKVKGMASMIEEVILDHRMPPWDVDAHVGKLNHEAALSVKDAQTLLRWVHQGADKDGEADPLENLAVSPQPEWPLGQPDIILRLPQPEQIPASGVLDYRHVTVFAGNDKEAWVGAVYAKPGNRKVLHHVIGRVLDHGEKDHLGQNEMFVGWAPGASQAPYPKGAGKFLPKNAKFDLELHYTTCGSPQTDSTEIGLYLMKEAPTHRFESVPVVNSQFEILPGDPNSKVQGLYGFTREATLYSVTPHMHVRGKWMRFELLRPDGAREAVASVPRYDFNWQMTYPLKKPMKIVPGTWAVLDGAYDNSARNPANPNPQKAIHWGEQSWDEMFLGWYNVAWELPKGDSHHGGGSGGAP